MNALVISSRLALAAAALILAAGPASAVPFGYRYVGSRVVSEGRVVLWYWNVDYVEVSTGAETFVARMYARAVDVNQERPYVAVVSCGARKYRGSDPREGLIEIEDGEPIDAVWRAGCDKGVAVSAAQRFARLNSSPMTVEASAGTSRAPTAMPTPAPALPVTTSAASAAPPATAATTSPPNATAATTSPEPVTTDPRRADPCVRFAETRSSPAGDATITNACGYAVEVTLCYKGSGSPFDCGTPSRRRYGDSLAPGVTHVLPEYRRARSRGVTMVACRGAAGTVFPRLDEASGKNGCF